MAADPASASDIIKDVSSVAQTAAIVAGGIWAYFKFAKGRIFRPRLEPIISGRLFTRNGFVYLLARAELKNVGASRVDIKQEGTGLRVLTAYADEPETILMSAWDGLGSFEIFINHEWIEPGETVSDEHLLVIKNDASIAFKLEIQIRSKAVLWHAMTIVQLDGDTSQKSIPNSV